MTKKDEARTRKAAKERTAKQLEQYHTKLALAATYEKYPEYHAHAEKLKSEAKKLHDQLVVKGVF